VVELVDTLDLKSNG